MSVDYDIAGRVIRLEGQDAEWARLDGFAPFRLSDEAGRKANCTISTGTPLENWEADPILETIDRFITGGYECVFGRYVGGYAFVMSKPGCKPLVLRHWCDGNIQCNVADVPETDAAALRFMLWVACGLALLPHGAVALHSSAVAWRGRCILFLGESGTGKSTHARLWLEHIPGSHILNDDSPIVRLAEGVPTAYGSPWSGKTPVYLNEHFPIAAVVRLSQAARNGISRLNRLESLGALLPSCPPPFARDERLTDHLCGIVSGIIERVPVFRLECCPDEEAARLVFKTVFGDGENDTE